MSDTNLSGKPGTGGDDALSVDDGAEAISDILNPETDLEDEDQAETSEEEGDAEEGEEAESDEEEPESEENAEEEDPVEGEADDGSDSESSRGRFVSQDAKYTLEDGTVITVGELARNNLYQRDYTQKTQELAEERKSFEAKQGQVDQTARQLQSERDFLLQAAQQFLPKPPDKSMIDTDFIGYQYAVAEYQEKVQAVQQLQQQAQAAQARQQQEEEQARQERIKAEGQKLLHEMPELAKPGAYQQFWSETVDVMSDYGFSQEELQSAQDHRFFKVFRDLMKYRKARQSAPKVKEKVQSKPVLKAGKRMDPKAKTSREQSARAEQLRKHGDFESGVSAIADLID